MQIPGCPSMFSRRRLELSRVLPALGVIFLGSALLSTPATAAPLPGAPPAVTGVVASPDRNQPYYYLYYKGAVDCATGRYSEAIRALTQFIDNADTSDLGNAFWLLGDAYSAVRDYEHAIAAYTAHLIANPNDATGIALKGRVLAHLALRQNKEAVVDYRAYVKLRPNDLVGCFGLYEIVGVPPTALIQQLTDAIAKDPSNMSLRTTLAAKQMEVKDYAAAIVQYNAILAAKPDDSAALYNRGVAYGLQKDTVKAAADFAAYTKMTPADAAGWNNLGVFLGQNKDYKGSIAAFTQYITLHPTDPEFIEAYKNRGIAYFNLQDWKNAQSDFVVYLTVKPKDADVLKLLPQIIQGPGGDAVSALLDVVKGPPGIADADAWFNLGIAYRGKKKYAEAVAAFSKSNALRADPETLFNRALTRYSIGQAGDESAYALAEADCATALAMRPDYADALLLKADSENAEKKVVASANDYFKYLGLPGVAVTNQQYAMRQVIKLSTDHKDLFEVYTMGSASKTNILELLEYTRSKPSDPTGFYNLGAAYLAKTDYLNAAGSFEKAAALDPNLLDAALLAASTYSSLAAANRADAAKATPFFDKAISFYDKASRIEPAVEHLRANMLYNEAATLEAKAKALDDDEPLKIAVVVWGKWEALSPHDAQLPTIQKHVGELMDKIERDDS